MLTPWKTLKIPWGACGEEVSLKDLKYCWNFQDYEAEANKSRVECITDDFSVWFYPVEVIRYVGILELYRNL